MNAIGAKDVSDALRLLTKLGKADQSDPAAAVTAVLAQGIADARAEGYAQGMQDAGKLDALGAAPFETATGALKR